MSDDSLRERLRRGNGGTCLWCGAIHGPRCPAVKALEFNPDGTIKRVEFVTEPPVTWLPQVRTDGPVGIPSCWTMSDVPSYTFGDPQPVAPMTTTRGWRNT